MPIRVALYGAILYGIGMPKYKLYGTFFNLLGNTLLSVYLAKKIGFVGPACATVFITYLEVTFYIHILTKNLNVRLRELFPWGRLFRNLLYGVISGAIVLPINFTNLPPWSKLAIGGISFAISYILISFKEITRGKTHPIG